MITTDFGDFIADRMRVEHRSLASRWFDRLLDLVPVDAREIFPTESLLDHIPGLILEIGAYLHGYRDEAIVANTAMLHKARELGVLRHAQQASLHQLLREYHLLSGVLVTFVLEEMDRLELQPAPPEVVALVSRLHQAVNVLSQSTVETFVTLYTETIADQRRRLEQFTRMAAHEWRQPLGALQFGVNLLSQADLDPEGTRRTLKTLQRSVTHLIDVTHKLEAIARVHNSEDNPVIQEVSAATLVTEAGRQLRDMAEARGVEIRVGDALPMLTVDVGRFELTFVNLLANAVKYSDPRKPVRYVEVTGRLEDDHWCRILVRDNGIGIPREALETIFRRFTRAHTERADMIHVSGIGLGLSIVDDCVKAMGGTVDVTSEEGIGTTFELLLPTVANSHRG